MLKFRILKPQSTDAGSYIGMREFQWEGVVEARYCDEKENSIFVLGSEFIRLGGCDKCFNPYLEYMWGSFETV